MRVELFLVCISAIMAMVTAESNKESVLVRELNELFSEDNLQQDDYLKNINKIEYYLKRKKDEAEKIRREKNSDETEINIQRESDSDVELASRDLLNLLSKKESEKKNQVQNAENELKELTNMLSGRDTENKDSVMDEADIKKEIESDVDNASRKFLSLLAERYSEKKDTNQDEAENNIQRESDSDVEIASRDLLNLLSKKESERNDPVQNAENELNELLSDKDTEYKDFTLDSIIQKKKEESKKDVDQCIDAKGLVYCYKKAIDKKCIEEPDEMERDCKRACRFCCDDDKTMLKPTKCEEFKNLSICEKEDHQDKIRVICPKTCGFCGRMAAEPPCVRTPFGCCWDGSTAKDHVGTATDGCPPCTDNYGSSFCKKFKIDCNDNWSKAGQQIRLFCPKTCGRCGPHRICRDDPRMLDSCRQYANEGACVSNFHAMKYSCEKTCKLCDQTTIDCRFTRYGCCADGKRIANGSHGEGCKECMDKNGWQTKCKYWKKHEVCRTHKNVMKTYCSGTCEFCKGS